MLTIRHIQPNHDSVVTQAVSVQHKHVRPDGAIAECVNLNCGPEDSRWIWEGHVFVMNDDGKTVAAFYLSPLSPPATVVRVD